MARAGGDPWPSCIPVTASEMGLIDNGPHSAWCRPRSQTDGAGLAGSIRTLPAQKTVPLYNTGGESGPAPAPYGPTGLITSSDSGCVRPVAGFLSQRPGTRGGWQPGDPFKHLPAAAISGLTFAKMVGASREMVSQVAERPGETRSSSALDSRTCGSRRTKLAPGWALHFG